MHGTPTTIRSRWTGWHRGQLPAKVGWVRGVRVTRWTGLVRAIVAKGGWTLLPEGRSIGPGSAVRLPEGLAVVVARRSMRRAGALDALRTGSTAQTRLAQIAATVTITLSSGLVGCGGARLDMVDQFPESQEDKEVSPAGLGNLMREEIPGITSEVIDKIAKAAFRAAEGDTGWYNKDFGFVLVVRHMNGLHHAIVLRTSHEGFPILPIDRLVKAARLVGASKEVQLDFATKLARCIAANGSCRALVIFDSGKALELALSYDTESPAVLSTTNRFLLAGSYCKGDFTVVATGGVTGFAQIGIVEGDKTRVLIFEGYSIATLPRLVPRP